MAEEIGYEPRFLKAVLNVNDEQPKRLVKLHEEKMETNGRRIAVLGLAFKDNTDDIRDSRALVVINELLKRGASIRAYDPMATENIMKVFPEIEYFKSAEEALNDADACLILTDWNEFRRFDGEFKAMKGKIIIDGRNMVNSKVRRTYDYEGLSW